MRKPKLAIALALLATVAVAGGAIAAPYVPIPGDTVAPNANNREQFAGAAAGPGGNVFCGGSTDAQMKIDEYYLAGGTVYGLSGMPDPAGPIRITYYNGKYVSWELTTAGLHDWDPNAVIVKGGPTSAVYSYSLLANDPTNPAVAPGLPGIPAAGDPAGGPDDADYRLTAPQNPNGNGPKYYGISHIQFCFDEKVD